MIIISLAFVLTVLLSLIQASNAGCDDYEGWNWVGNSCESIVDGQCDFVNSFFEFNGMRANEACCKCGGGVENNICENEPGWYWGGNPMFTCANSVRTDADCQLISRTFSPFNGKTATEACCVCGGGTHVGPVTPSPTNNPTTSPTTSPTSEPTKSASDHPTSSPTTNPTDSPTEKCFDEPGWYWGGNPIHTCANTLSEAFCDTISDLGSFKGKTAAHACCVCGGGAHIAAPSDPPSSSPSEIFSSAPSRAPCEHDERWYYMGNEEFTCEVVTPAFCPNVNLHPQNGLYASEACCLCGGGIHVTKSPTATPTASPTVKPSVSPTIPEQCTDVPGWFWAGVHSCDVIAPTTCDSISTFFTHNGLTANDACCICGGGLATSTTKPTKTPTASPTIAPTTSPTVSPTDSPTAGPTSEPTANLTSSPTSTPSASDQLATTVCTDESDWYWNNNPNLKCDTISSSDCDAISKFFSHNGMTANDACCICGGGNMSSVTDVTNSPTEGPTKSPTEGPTKSPTEGPTKSPTGGPTTSPSNGPTKSPTEGPTKNPTAEPTAASSLSPTANPTVIPTAQPTGTPTAISNDVPTANPTEAPYIRTCKPNEMMGQTIITYTPEVPRVCFKIILDENGEGAFYGDHRNPSCSKPYDENSHQENKKSYGVYSYIVGNRFQFDAGEKGYSGLLIFRETNQVKKSQMIVTAWIPQALQFKATVLIPSCQPSN